MDKTVDPGLDLAAFVQSDADPTRIKIDSAPNPSPSIPGVNKYILNI